MIVSSTRKKSVSAKDGTQKRCCARSSTVSVEHAENTEEK
jgi:hypothetical protein